MTRAAACPTSVLGLDWGHDAETPEPRYECFRLAYSSGTVVMAFYVGGAPLPMRPGNAAWMPFMSCLPRPATLGAGSAIRRYRRHRSPELTKGTQVYCEDRLSLGSGHGQAATVTARAGLNLAA